MKRLRILAFVLMLTMTIGLLSGVSFAEEKRVLTLGATQDYTDDFANWDHLKRVQEELNMEIDLIYLTKDALATMMAGGELPDLVLSERNLPTVISNNLAMNVRPLLEEYCPNALLPSYKPTVDLLCSLMGGEDNGMYIFCPLVGMGRPQGGNTLVQRGYVVRWDYYKELGCPPINNDDEYIDLLLKMHELHPTAEDGSPVFLMGTEGGFGDIGGYRASWRVDIAQNVWCIDLYRSDNFTNELIDGYTDVERSCYWNDLRFYNKVWRAGGGEGGFGYDPDCFTMTNDEFKVKVANDQYLGMEYAYGDLYKETSKQDPETDKAYIVAPSAGMITYCWYYMPLGNAPTFFYFIPKDSKNWELALQYLNYMCDPDFMRYCMSGVEGKDWYYDEAGVPHLTDEAAEGIKNNDPYWSSEGNGFHQDTQLMLLRGSILCDDGYPIDLTWVPEMYAKTQSKLMDQITEYYNADFYFQVFEDAGAKDMRNDMGENICATLSDIPSEIRRIRTAANDILTAAMPELIFAKTDEEFEAIQAEVLEELEEIEIDKAWEWINDNWQAPKAVFDELLPEALAAYGLEPWPVPEE